MMGHIELRIEGRGDPLDLSLPSPIAELVARSALLGRRTFSVPTKITDAERVLAAAKPWLLKLKQKLEGEIVTPAAGSGYEELVRVEVLKLLNVNEAAFEPVIPQRVELR